VIVAMTRVLVPTPRETLGFFEDGSESGQFGLRRRVIHRFRPCPSDRQEMHPPLDVTCPDQADLAMLRGLRRLATL
jgi:hypothetical protein